MCAVSLSSSIAVMYIHNRSSGHDASLAMPNWVNLTISFVASNETTHTTPHNSPGTQFQMPKISVGEIRTRSLPTGCQMQVGTVGTMG